MSIRSKAVVVVMGVLLACWLSPVLGAEGSGEPTGGNAAAEVSRRMEDMQKEVDRLQSELAELKRQLKGAPAAASPTASVPPSSVTTALSAAEPAQGGTPPASAPSAPVSFLSSISLSGTVDGYYGYNFNQPRVKPLSTPGGSGPSLNFGTGLRAFDGRNNQFALNLVELNLDKTPEASSRLGFHMAFGYGDAMNVVNSTDPGGLGLAQYLKEGYLSYLAPVGKGLQLDFGKFVTQHGAEVIETKDNWNYSRSLLFSFAIPFYHYGLRAKYTLSDKYTLAGYVVNGWNNVVDNNTGKTLGLQFVWNPTKKVNVVQNYMVGAETPGTNRNYRQLLDTVVTYSPTGKLSLMANFDYGRGDRVAGIPRPVWWSGGAGYLRYAFNDRYAVITRYEYYNDHDGFTIGGPPQHVNEFTGTFERRIARNLITRWEFRRDVASSNVFLKGDNRPVTSQNTVMGGLVYVFDTRDTK